MKICWDSLNKLKYDNKKHTWKSICNSRRYTYVNACKTCGEPFLAVIYKNKVAQCCDLTCSNKDKDHIESIRNSLTGRSLSEDHKKCPLPGSGSYG